MTPVFSNRKQFLFITRHSLIIAATRYNFDTQLADFDTQFRTMSVGLLGRSAAVGSHVDQQPLDGQQIQLVPLVALQPVGLVLTEKVVDLAQAFA